MSTTQRIVWIDHLKAIGIFLVVYGHSLSVWWGARHWIYAFHMPLFFLISGYLLRPPKPHQTFRSQIVHAARGLMPAYFTFALIGYSLWVLVLRHFGSNDKDAADPFMTFLMIPYGSGTPPVNHLQPIELWFFPALLVAQILCSGLLHLRAAYYIPASMILLIAGFLLPKELALPFELETAAVAQAFMVLGYETKRIGLLEQIPNVTKPMLGLALLLTGSITAFANIQTDFYNSTFGNPILFLATALCLTLGLTLLVYNLKANHLSSLAAENTIILFPLHTFVFSLFAAVYVYAFHLPLNVRTIPAVGLVASVLNCLLLLAIAPLFRQYLPWVYGLRTSVKQEDEHSAQQEVVLRAQ